MFRSDRKDPTADEIDSFVHSYMRVHRKVRESSGPHIISDCPACGKQKHLYLNTDTGLWDCKVGKCGESGNLWKLASLLGVRVRDAPIAVVGLRAAVMGTIPNGGPMAKSVPAEPKGLKGIDVAKVKTSCERVFRDGDEKAAKVLAYLRSRGLDDEAIRHFSIGVAQIKDGGAPAEVAISIPYIEDDVVTMIKLRNLEADKDRRKFRRVKGGESSLFNGPNVRGLRQVVLVEGEMDAVSLWQLGVCNVASTSLGAKKQIPDHWVDVLRDAEDIVLWYDDDEAGQTSAQNLMAQLGTYRCRIAVIPDEVNGKDANDILQKHGEEASSIVRRIVKEARGVENKLIVRPSHYADMLIGKINQGADSLGLSSGYAGLDRILKGIRPRELTLVTGHTSHGKTTFTTDLISGLASRGHPIAVSSLENGPGSIVTKLYQRVAGRPIGEIDDEQKRDEAMTALSALDNDPIFLIDREGRTTVPEIVDDLKYARHRYGIVAAVVDHLHFLKKGHPRVMELEHLEDSIMAFVEATRELGIHIFLVAHPRGLDEDILPSGDTVKGTSSAKQLVDNGITVYRARTMAGGSGSKALKIKNSLGQRIPIELAGRDVLVDVWKNREHGVTGSTVLEFDPRRSCYTDKDEPADAGKEQDHGQQEAFDDPWAS